MWLNLGNNDLCFVLLIYLSNISNIAGNTVTTHIRPKITPFAITSPISFPSVKFILQSAKKPATVVNALPKTDTNVSAIDAAIASFLSLVFSKLLWYLWYKNIEKSVVTPSWSTALIAFVMYDISPNIIFVPILYIIAIPILLSNINGTIYESNETVNTNKQSITAITTYIATSLLDKSIVSFTIALIPPTFALSFIISLISVIAFKVFSFDVVSSNVTIIRVLSPLFTFSNNSSGNISSGITVPVISFIDITLFTDSIFLISFSQSRISFSLLLSTDIIVKAPILNSSFNIFWPFIVSISSGRYINIS